MVRSKIIPCFFTIAALTPLAQIKPTPLTGAWRVTEAKTTGPNANTNSSPQPGLYIFTGTHFSAMEITSRDPRPDISVRPKEGDNLTVAQLLAAWAPFGAYSGTYTISGNEVALTAVVSKNPGVMERHETIVFSYKIDGDKLTLISVRDVKGTIANPKTWTLTRIE